MLLQVFGGYGGELFAAPRADGPLAVQHVQAEADRVDRPGTRPVRSGLHRARGVTTKPVERSHIPTRDRPRNTRGLNTTATARRFLEGLEAVYAPRHGPVVGVQPDGTEHDRMRQVAAGTLRIGRSLRRPR